MTVLDNLVNSKVESLRRVGELTGKAEKLAFHEVDLQDYDKLDAVLAKLRPCHACIHFAGGRRRLTMMPRRASRGGPF